MTKDITKYLPLSESTAYILLALAEPLHGYGIMQKVEQISEATVKTHLIHIFAKLGVDDRTAAVTVAMERGILRLEK